MNKKISKDSNQKKLDLKAKKLAQKKQLQKDKLAKKQLKKSKKEKLQKNKLSKANEKNLKSKQLKAKKLAQKKVARNKKLELKKNKLLALKKLRAKKLAKKQLKRDKKLELKKNKLLIKKRIKQQNNLIAKYSKKILKSRKIISLTNNKPSINENIIELFNVSKSYISGEVETPIIKNISLKIKKGNFVVVLGPSGSGKTTLLNLISGLDRASNGDVFVNGYNLTLLKDSHLTTFRRLNVGFIFQQYNLLTNLNAKENVEVGENLAQKKHQKWTIEKIFEKIDMAEQMNKYPHQMSGGQQQRVSIARALAKNPIVLFGDEPTGALDEKTGKKVLSILLNIQKEFESTIILVTHNPNIAKIADVIIKVHDGKIEEIVQNEHPTDPNLISWQ